MGGYGLVKTYLETDYDDNDDDNNLLLQSRDAYTCNIHWTTGVRNERRGEILNFIPFNVPPSFSLSYWLFRNAIVSEKSVCVFLFILLLLSMSATSLK
jgi:hypothetical protein